MKNQKEYLEKQNHPRGMKRTHSLNFRELNWQALMAESEEQNIPIGEFLEVLLTDYLAKKAKKQKTI